MAEGFFISALPFLPLHALPILKQACLEALETDGEPGDPGRFFSIVDPGSVLELIELAETSITDEEVQALHTIIAEMGEYIRQSAPGPQGDELLLRARQIVGVTSR
jgi:predicted Zn-dependent protease